MPVEGYAITITLHGDEVAVETIPIEGEEVDYETLNSAVDGYIERVSLEIPSVNEHAGFPIDVWVNEEGLLKQLPMNFLATGFAQVLSHREYILVGNAIITSGADDPEGRTLPLSEEQAKVVGAVLVAVAGRLAP